MKWKPCLESVSVGFMVDTASMSWGIETSIMMDSTMVEM
jgi:hypothetical protein